MILMKKGKVKRVKIAMVTGDMFIYDIVIQKVYDISEGVFFREFFNKVWEA